MKKLSIIILFYNSEPYMTELLNRLAPQITDEVEVLVIDDGSDVTFTTNYPWVVVHRQDNHGVGYSRNRGLELSTGEYLSFVDSDDLVSENYVAAILDKIRTEEFDFCYLSWRTLPDGAQADVKLNSIEDVFPTFNLCCWNRVYKRSFIGDLRFNERKSIGEDAEFVKNLNESGKKKSFISDYMYFYRTSTPNSLTHKFQEGRLCTRRIIYYFPAVRQHMTWLIDEFRVSNEDAEIILMTNENEIPELAKYAMITPPKRIHGTELRGYDTRLFMRVPVPIKADIIIWTERTCAIGGIETFIYNFCKQLSPYYDIIVLYRVIDGVQKARLTPYARVIELDASKHMDCDTLIINRITDRAPRNVSFRKKVQMVHSCKWQHDLRIPQDNDKLVAVSEAVARSYSDFKPDHVVIHNLTNPTDIPKALLLVSATRTSTSEKGQRRMIVLSNLLKAKDIPFVWICFSDSPIDGAGNIIFFKPTLNIAPYIKAADYLVQLSDHEGFCYSLVEAMELGTPVLTTPLEVLPEIGFIDGVNGYVIPFNVNEAADIEKIYHRPLKGTFTYKYDNERRIEQWKEILGNGQPRKSQLAFEFPLVTVRALLKYYDLEHQKTFVRGSEFQTHSNRAYELMQKRFVELV